MFTINTHNLSTTGNPFQWVAASWTTFDITIRFHLVGRSKRQEHRVQCSIPCEQPTIDLSNVHWGAKVSDIWDRKWFDTRTTSEMHRDTEQGMVFTCEQIIGCSLRLNFSSEMERTWPQSMCGQNNRRGSFVTSRMIQRDPLTKRSRRRSNGQHYHDRVVTCCTVQIVHQWAGSEAKQNIVNQVEDLATIEPTSLEETRLLHSPCGHRTGTDLNAIGIFQVVCSGEEERMTFNGLPSVNIILHGIQLADIILTYTLGNKREDYLSRENSKISYLPTKLTTARVDLPDMTRVNDIIVADRTLKWWLIA